MVHGCLLKWQATALSTATVVSTSLDCFQLVCVRRPETRRLFACARVRRMCVAAGRCACTWLAFSDRPPTLNPCGEMQTGQRGWVAEGGATPIRCIARLLDLACGYAVEGNICPRELTSLVWYLRHFCPAGAGALTAICCHNARSSIFRCMH